MFNTTPGGNLCAFWWWQSCACPVDPNSSTSIFRITTFQVSVLICLVYIIVTAQFAFQVANYHVVFFVALNPYAILEEKKGAWV